MGCFFNIFVVCGDGVGLSWGCGVGEVEEAPNKIDMLRSVGISHLALQGQGLLLNFRDKTGDKGLSGEETCDDAASIG